MKGFLFCCLALLPFSSRADPRPSEQDLFGSPKTGTDRQAGTLGTEPSSNTPAAKTKEASEQDEAEIFGGATPSSTSESKSEDAFGAEGVGPSDPLKIGGQIYLRAFSQAG